MAVTSRLDDRVRLAAVLLGEYRDVSDVCHRDRRVSTASDLDRTRLAVVPDRSHRHAYNTSRVDDHTTANIGGCVRADAAAAGHRA